MNTSYNIIYGSPGRFMWSGGANGMVYKNANTSFIGGNTNNADGWGVQNIKDSFDNQMSALSVRGFSNKGDPRAIQGNIGQGYLKWPGLSIGIDDYQDVCVLLKLKADIDTKSWQAQKVDGDKYYKVIDIPTGITG